MKEMGEENYRDVPLRRCKRCALREDKRVLRGMGKRIMCAWM